MRVRRAQFGLDVRRYTFGCLQVMQAGSLTLLGSISGRCCQHLVMSVSRVMMQRRLMTSVPRVARVVGWVLTRVRVWMRVRQPAGMLVSMSMGSWVLVVTCHGSCGAP